MKYIKAISLSCFLIFLFSCYPILVRAQEIFNIEIWDYDAPNSFVIHYKIEYKSIKVVFESGIIGEETKILMERNLSSAEVTKLNKELSILPLDELNPTYIHPLIDDGDQKNITMQFGNVIKKIFVSNVYKTEIAKIINLINQFLKPNLQIKYQKVIDEWDD